MLAASLRVPPAPRPLARLPGAIQAVSSNTSSSAGAGSATVPTSNTLISATAQGAAGSGGAAGAASSGSAALDAAPSASLFGRLVTGSADLRVGVRQSDLRGDVARLVAAGALAVESGRLVARARGGGSARAGAGAGVGAGAGGGQATPDFCDTWWRLADTNATWRVEAARQPGLLGVFDQETGGGGDCKFYSFAAGINERLYGGGQDRTCSLGALTMLDARALVADAIDASNLDEFLYGTPVAFPAGASAWTPAQRVAYVQAIVRAPGTKYQGETGTLAFLCAHAPLVRALKLGFAVLSERRLSTDPGGIRVELIRTPETRHVMLLHNLGNAHWRLMAACATPASASMSTTWPIDSLPSALFALMRHD